MTLSQVFEIILKELLHFNFEASRYGILVRIKPLKAWHDVTSLEYIIHLMIFQVHFYLSLIHVLHFIRILVYHLLHCTWLGSIRSCTKDPSHEFLTSRWFIQLMVSALVCMVTHWTRPIMSLNIRLSGSHDFTKLLYYIVS